MTGQPPHCWVDFATLMAPPKASVKASKFTTIKVRDRLRRWLKIEAASQGVPMYELVEKILAKGEKGKPWEEPARA